MGKEEEGAQDFVPDFRGLLLGITHLILKEEGPQVRLGLVIDSRGRWLKSEGKEMVEAQAVRAGWGKV